MDPADTVKYNWVDVQIVGTLYILSIQVSVDATNIMATHPFDCFVFLVDMEKRMCNTRVNLWFPVSEFEMEVLRYLNIASYQLQSGSQDYIKMFQFWAEYRSQKPSLQFFSNCSILQILPNMIFETSGLLSFVSTFPRFTISLRTEVTFEGA